MTTSACSNNILITNVADDISTDEIKTFFSYAGQITSVSVSEDPRQFIIIFENEESANTALLMTGAVLGNKRIVVELTPLTQSTPNDVIHINTERLEEDPNNYTKTSIITSLLAKGYHLAENAYRKAVENDILNRMANEVKQKSIAVDETTHFTEYLALGTAMTFSKAQFINNKYQLTERILNSIDHADDVMNMSGTFCLIQDQLEKLLDNLFNANKQPNTSNNLGDNSVETEEKLIEKEEKAIEIDEIPMSCEVKSE
ncbi:hypothetical protein QTN25_005289 [Entamoeba marina]